jgi:ABC-type multidrug transport system fused ATPase/permease subunit
VLALGLLAAALEGIGIGLIIPLLSLMLGEPDTSRLSAGPAAFLRLASGLPEGDRAALLVGAILALILLKNVVGYLNSVLAAWIYGRASTSIRSALAGRLTKVGHGLLVDQPPGRLLNILSNESWRASDAVHTSINMLVSVAAGAILILFLLLLSWEMTAGVALGLLVLQGVHAVMSGRLRPYSERVSATNGRLASHMLHLVQGGRLIRLFGRQAWEHRSFDRASETVRGAVFALERQRVAIAPVMEVLQAALFLTVVVFAWRGGAPFPVIAAFLVLLYRLQPQVRAVQNSITQLRAWSGSLGEVDWLLDPAGKPQEPSGAGPPRDLCSGIELDGVTVSFGPSRETPALHKVSAHIAAGRSTAIVGRSGSGKTTLVNLLCRFVEPSEGAVLVDGVPLHEIDAGAWRERIALASQDLDLIDGTIAENILYGAPAADVVQVEAAARLADAHQFITELPDGYATYVGYRGASLSAGQRQRVALARALIRDPEILILDEATNALDSLSEAAVVQTLRSRAGRRTTIVVSHHHSTIGFCDDILVLHQGEVAAAGALADLTAGDMDGFFDFRPAVRRPQAIAP